MIKPVKKMTFQEYLEWLDYHRAMFSDQKKRIKRHPHPGEILKRDYLDKHNVTQTSLSKKIGCTHAKINEIVNGKRGVTTEFALHLEKVTEIKAETWMRIQVYYDLDRLRQEL